MTSGAQSSDMAGLRDLPTKADLAVFATPSSPDSAVQPPPQPSVEDQGRKLQDADAAIGKPLFLVQKEGDAETSDLLHYVAGGKKRPPPKTDGAKGAEPPVKPDVVFGPDGKIQQPTPQDTKPEVGVPERLPQTKPKPDLEVACEIAHQKCNETCAKIAPTSKVKIIAKGACYAGCFAAYALCRASGLIANGSQ
ncbi:MAG: hypothetical protein AAGA21_17600 [Pseudomonadota bacterium]